MEGLKYHQPDVVVSDIANEIFEEEKNDIKSQILIRLLKIHGSSGCTVTSLKMKC